MLSYPRHLAERCIEARINLKELRAEPAILDRHPPGMAGASLQGCIHGVWRIAGPARSSEPQGSRAVRAGQILMRLHLQQPTLRTVEFEAEVPTAV